VPNFRPLRIPSPCDRAPSYPAGIPALNFHFFFDFLPANREILIGTQTETGFLLTHSKQTTVVLSNRYKVEGGLTPISLRPSGSRTRLDCLCLLASLAQEPDHRPLPLIPTPPLSTRYTNANRSLRNLLKTNDGDAFYPVQNDDPARLVVRVRRGGVGVPPAPSKAEGSDQGEPRDLSTLQGEPRPSQFHWNCGRCECADPNG